MNTMHLLFGFFVLAAISAPEGHTQTAPPATQPAKQKAASAPAGQSHGDEGERIFQQNCSRCHNTPQGFSPRIAGTVVRHMRVRASLSQHDEQELLRFFNP